MTPMLLILALATASTPAPPPSQRQVTVVGSATVTFHPNRVTAVLVVRSTGRDDAAARKSTEAKTQKVLAALRGAGADPQNVSPTVLSSSPEYRGNEISRYAAAQALNVTFTDLKKIDAALAAAIKADATVTSVVIANTEHATYEGEARVAAAKAAHEQARQLLDAVGARPGLPVTLSDATPQVDSQSVGGVVPAADGSVATGLAARELTVTSRVTVRFDIEPKG